LDLLKKEARIEQQANQNSQKILEDIKQTYNITEHQLTQLLKQKQESIPIHVFNNQTLSALETIVKYLKENKNLKHSKIAKKLNRHQKTIWTTYQNSKQKRSEKFQDKESEISIHIEIFSNRTLSVLENITKHLKENYDLNYTEIANLLNRSPKTIWTVYQRVKKKL